MTNMQQANKDQEQQQLQAQEEEQQLTEQQQYALVPFSFSNPFHDVLRDEIRFFPIANHQIRIEQNWKNDGKGGTSIGFGASVYDAAIVLSLYLAKKPEIVYNKKVIELGCGPGLVGITTGFLGAKHVDVSDGDPASVALTRRNICANGLDNKRCVAAEYLWGNEEHEIVKQAPFDVILGADIVACPYASAFEQLLKSFCLLAGPETKLILAYKLRHGSESSFFPALEDFFQLKQVDPNELHEDFKDSGIVVYEAMKKCVV